MKSIYNKRQTSSYLFFNYSYREAEILSYYLRAYYFDRDYQDYHDDYLIKEAHIILPIFYKQKLNKHNYVSIKRW